MGCTAVVDVVGSRLVAHRAQITRKKLNSRSDQIITHKKALFMSNDLICFELFSGGLGPVTGERHSKTTILSTLGSPGTPPPR